MDAAQGHLAGQIVVTQFLADDMAARIHAPGLALPEMCRLTRTTDDLLRTVARLERALERRQVRVMPFRDVGAVDGFDLDALDGVWSGGVLGALRGRVSGLRRGRSPDPPGRDAARQQLPRRNLPPREPAAAPDGPRVSPGGDTPPGVERNGAWNRAETRHTTGEPSATESRRRRGPRGRHRGAGRLGRWEV